MTLDVFMYVSASITKNIVWWRTFLCIRLQMKLQNLRRSTPPPLLFWQIEHWANEEQTLITNTNAWEQHNGVSALDVVVSEIDELQLEWHWRNDRRVSASEAVNDRVSTANNDDRHWTLSLMVDVRNFAVILGCPIGFISHL